MVKRPVSAGQYLALAQLGSVRPKHCRRAKSIPLMNPHVLTDLRPRTDIGEARNKNLPHYIPFGADTDQGAGHGKKAG
jgi:hypothetical protein